MVSTNAINPRTKERVWVLEKTKNASLLPRTHLKFNQIELEKDVSKGKEQGNTHSYTQNKHGE